MYCPMCGDSTPLPKSWLVRAHHIELQHDTVMIAGTAVKVRYPNRGVDHRRFSPHIYRAVNAALLSNPVTVALYP